MDIISVTQRLPSGKTASSDGIISEVLTAVETHKPKSVILLYNNCLKTGIFPSEWKEARLVLLYKDGNKDLTAPSSFRPISMINSIEKLMERHVFARLGEYLNTIANSSNPSQYGFRYGRSTLDTMEKVGSTAGWTNRESTQHRDICVLILLILL